MKLTIGQTVTFVDPYSNERPALVTAVFQGMSGQADGCNVVIVSDDENKKDPFGRQVERFTSVPHQSGQPAHGNYWK